METIQQASLTLPDFKIFYKAIGIKTVSYWYKDRYTDQWYRKREPRKKPSSVWSNDLQQGCQGHKKGKDGLFKQALLGKLDYQHETEWRQTFIKYHTQKLTQAALKT